MAQEKIKVDAYMDIRERLLQPLASLRALRVKTAEMSFSQQRSRLHFFNGLVSVYLKFMENQLQALKRFTKRLVQGEQLREEDL